MLSLPWPRVQSLVGELRSCKPCGAAKNKIKIKRAVGEAFAIQVTFEQRPEAVRE